MSKLVFKFKGEIRMSYAKAKGTKFEGDIVKYLIDCGFSDARRIVLHGGKDEGDIQLGEVNNPRFVIETKSYNREYNYKMIEDFVQEAHTEYKNAHKDQHLNQYCALLIAKRVNLGVADSWLCWKNKYGITIRCRLGDLINQENFINCTNNEDRFNKLEYMLRNLECKNGTN